MIQGCPSYILTLRSTWNTQEPFQKKTERNKTPKHKSYLGLGIDQTVFVKLYAKTSVCCVSIFLEK